MTRANDIANIFKRTAAEIAASVTPTDYSYPPGDVRRYGWVAGGVASTNATALQSALDAAPSTGGTVIIPEGTGDVDAGIIWPADGTTLRSHTVRGPNGTSVPASGAAIINYTGSGTLFDLRNGSGANTTGQICIEGVALTAAASAGLRAVDAYDLQGSEFRRLGIIGFDVGIGIERYCYYCKFDDVTLTGCVTKGAEIGLLNGTTFAKCRIDAIDDDGPVSGVGIGIDINAGGATGAFEGCWFENTRIGVKCKDTQQLVFKHSYWEAVVQGVYVDTQTSTMNQILDFDACSFYHVHNDSSLVFSNNAVDLYVFIRSLGTLTNGGLTNTRIINKTGATPNARIESILEITGAKIDLGYLRPWLYQAALDSTMDFFSFADGDATPSVVNGRNFQTFNTGATTITALDGGARGQEVFVYFGDSNTAIDFTGTTLKGNAGVNWSPATGDFMRCVFDGTNWLCQVTDATT